MIPMIPQLQSLLGILAAFLDVKTCDTLGNAATLVRNMVELVDQGLHLMQTSAFNSGMVVQPERPNDQRPENISLRDNNP